jgi:hypothetical protein
VGHVAQYGPLDDIKWLGFENKFVGNFFSIAGDPDPHLSPTTELARTDRFRFLDKFKFKT